MVKANFQTTFVLKGHCGALSCAKFSPCGYMIASAATDGNVVLWGAKEEEWIHKTTLRCHEEGISQVGFSSDSTRVLTASDDKSAKLFDVSAEKCVATFKDHSKAVLCSAMSPDMGMVLTGSFDETVKLWDVKSGSCVKTLNAHSDPVTSVNFKPDGKMFVTAGYDGLSRIWDSSSHQCVHTLLSDSTHPVAHAQFSPNGKFVLAGTMDSKLRLWDYQKNKCLKTYQGHKNAKYSMFSAFAVSNGLWVLSGSEDHKVVIWNLQTKQVVQRLSGHSDVVITVDAHKKRDVILSGSLAKDCSLRIWEQQPLSEASRVIKPKEVLAPKLPPNRKPSVR